MHKIFNKTAIMILLIAVFTSCKKSGEQFDLDHGLFPATSLTVSANNVVLASTTENDTVLRFNFLAASFGKDPVVSYTLQMDTPADTLGNNWGLAKNFTIANAAFKYGFLGKDLNNILNAIGLTPGTANDLVFRIKADVNQFNGTASTVIPVYTNVVPVNITSYELNLYVPGAYQGWNPAAAPIISPVNGRPGMYEGYVYITGGGTQYFKFTNAPDWNHTNYGDGGNGTFSIDGNAGGLYVNEDGYYELTADLNTNRWTATKTTWGIIGDATPGGWSNDTPMTYDPATQVWTVTADMVQNGSFKFRANNAWAIDFGIDGAGNIQYADNPFLGYNGTLNNLSVPTDGNYTITLDLHVSQHYTFILHKN